MVQFISHSDGDDVEWVSKQGNLLEFANVKTQNTIIIEKLSEKHDGKKLECKSKTKGWKTEIDLLVICEYNLEGLR